MKTENTSDKLDVPLKEVLAHFPKIALAVLFGSVALVVSAQIAIWIWPFLLNKR